MKVKRGTDFMQMKKKVKQEKGSMAVYVGVVLMGFLLLLTATYISSIATKKAQLKTILGIKQSYESLKVELEEAKIPTTTITVSTTAVMVNGKVTAQVEQRTETNHNLDLSSCKYVYNTTGAYIGKNAASYTGGTFSSASQNLTLSASSAGTYYLHVLTVDAGGNASETISSPISVVSPAAISYATANSTSNPYSTFTAPADGTYKLQTWGAQGGYRSSATYGGKGGYSVGTVTLTKGDKLYVYVGGSGNTGKTAGGYNGGGPRVTYNGGGGATDMRIGGNTLKHRLIVAGGGGSDGATSKQGMYGGGSSGGSNTQSYGSGGGGATQTAGGTGSSSASGKGTAGTYGDFGQGGKGYNASSGYAGAGGGGWYGGAGSYPDSSGDDDRGGGGGSGYVLTSSSSKPSGYAVNAKYNLASASTKAGNTSFEAPGGGSETGHSGNGYAKITPLTVTGSSSTTTTDPTQGEGEDLAYIKDGLILHYDGINNTGSGHSASTTKWKDLSGKGNDGTLSKALVANSFYWSDNSIVLSNVSSALETYVNTPLKLSGKERSITYTVDATGLTGSIWGDTSSSNTNGLFNYHTFVANRGNSTSVQNRYDYTFAKSGIIEYTVTLSSSQMKFYVNGELVNTASNTVGLTTTNNLRLLAAYYSGQNATNLKMYNFMVYDRVLSDNEVADNFKVDKERFIGTKVAYTEDFDTWKNYGASSTTASCANGIVTLKSSSADPMLHMNNVTSFNPNEYRYIDVRYKTSNAGFMEFFMIENPTNQTYAISQELIADGQWHVLTIDLWSNAAVKGRNPITGWRWDWISTSGATMEVDYIKIRD